MLGTNERSIDVPKLQRFNQNDVKAELHHSIRDWKKDKVRAVWTGPQNGDKQNRNLFSFNGERPWMEKNREHGPEFRIEIAKRVLSQGRA